MMNTLSITCPAPLAGGSTFGDRPTVLWKPTIQVGDPSFGVRPDGFGFNLFWADGKAVVVEASTNLLNPGWLPLQTNILSLGSFYFSDPQWTNYPSRIYHLPSP